VFVEHAFALVRVRGLDHEAHVIEDPTMQEVPFAADQTSSVRLRASFIGFDLFAAGPTLPSTCKRQERIHSRTSRCKHGSDSHDRRAGSRGSSPAATGTPTSPRSCRSVRTRCDATRKSVFIKLRFTSRTEVQGRLLWG
jgi:hypothetical protein